MQVRRLGALSLAKVMGVIYAVFGLLFGAVFSLFALLGAAFGGMAAESGEEAAAAVVGLLFGVGAIIALPIFYGIVGFVGGLITAWLYNLAAKIIGGIELELE